MHARLVGGKSKGRDRPQDALEMLERCHTKVTERMQELGAAAARWAKGDERGLDDARDVARYLLRAGERHESDEEESIFPRFAADASLTEVIKVLRAEHEHHRTEARFLAELLEAERPDPEALTNCAERLRTAYRVHIELEDQKLMPVVAALPAAELDAIFDDMRARRGH